MINKVFILNKEYEIIGLLTNEAPKGCPFWKYNHHRVLENAYETFEFFTWINHINGTPSLLINENKLAFRDKDGILRVFRIKIVEDTTDTNERYIWAEYDSNELYNTIVRPQTIGGTPRAVFGEILLGTRWDVGETDPDLVTESVTYTEHISAIQAIHEAAKEFGAEIQFRMAFEGRKVSKRRVDILSRIGEYTGKRVDYYKDLKGLKRTIDTTDMATALIGLGKSSETTNKPIGIESASWSTANGNPVNKPAGQDWIGDPEALSMFGDSEGRHIFRVFTDSEESNPTILLDKTWKELQRIKNGSINYEVDIEVLEDMGFDAEKIRLGDTIIVKDHTFDIPLILEARILEYDDKEEGGSVLLGEYRLIEVSTDAKIARIQSALAKKQPQWDNGLQVIESDTEPDPKVDGMYWLDTSKNPNIWKRWIQASTSWIPATPSTASQLTYTDGSTVQALQPAAAGADVTSQNTAADTAKVNGVPAADITTTLNDMASDNKLTPIEKQQLKKEWDVIVAEKATIEANATTYAITTEKTNFVNSYNTLNTYITPLLSNLTVTSDIVGTTLRTNFDDYFDKKAILQKVITETARTLANNAQTTANTATDISKARIEGKIIFKDPTFRDGSNNIALYNNLANGVVTLTRIAKPADAPTSSSFAYQIDCTGAANPGWGGYSQTTTARANAKYIVKIIAKIPIGYTLMMASNSLGTGGSYKFVTPAAGTGKYEEYIGVIQCGTGGTFSTTGYFYLDGGTTPTPTVPLTWIVAYSTMFDVTDMDYSVLDMSSDNKLTPIEKQQLKKEWDVIVAEKVSIEANATTYGITTEKTNFVNSYNALNTYLTPLLTDLTVTSDIVGTTLRTNFDDYFDKKAILQKVITETARTIANSKAKTFTAQPTIPYSIGDIWKNGQTTYICTVARSTGSFTAADWTLSGDVTSQNTAADTTNVAGVSSTTVKNNAAAGATANGLTSAWKMPGLNTINGQLIEVDTVKAAQIDVTDLFADTAFINSLNTNNFTAVNITGGSITGAQFTAQGVTTTDGFAGTAYLDNTGLLFTTSKDSGDPNYPVITRDVQYDAHGMNITRDQPGIGSASVWANLEDGIGYYGYGGSYNGDFRIWVDQSAAAATAFESAYPLLFRTPQGASFQNGLSIENGYLNVETFDDTTYGTGKAQFYYDGVNKRLNLRGRDVNNNVVPIALNLDSIDQENMKAPSLLGSWVNYGGAFRNCAYWKDKQGVVHITGLPRDGAAGSNIFQLPAEYRPWNTETFSVPTTGGHARIDIDVNGYVKVGSAFTTYVSLAGISFRAEK